MRRSALQSSSSSLDAASSDEVERARWQRQLEQVYGAGSGDQQTSDTNTGPAESIVQGDNADGEAYEFKLFSSKSNQDSFPAQQPPKIVLRSPSPESTEPGFVRPRRLENYYFTGALTGKELSQYREVAVEGDDVLRESRSKWVSASWDHLFSFG